MNQLKPSCIDFFCGAGGLSIGLHRAGFDIRFAFDADHDMVESYNSNEDIISPVARNYRVEDLTPSEIIKFSGLNRGECVLIAGGPPCQGFSIQRIGEDIDPRNNLALEFIKRITAIKPWFFLFENVPGLKGARGVKILKRILAKAEQEGYKCYMQFLDASDFGVSQRRKRLFIVGEKLPSRIARFKFPNPTTPDKASKRTVKMAIGMLPSPPLDGKDHPLYPYHRRDRLSKKNIERLKALRQGQGRENLPARLLANCHKISANRIGHRNVYGRMEWNEIAPTITARFDSFTRGKFGHPEDLRTISLREGAILQGFPLKYQFVGTKVSVARQIGNAVPPLLAEALGKSILQAYKEELLPSHTKKIIESPQLILR